jgi:predicted acyl esterase
VRLSLIAFVIVECFTIPSVRFTIHRTLKFGLELLYRGATMKRLWKSSFAGLITFGCVVLSLGQPGQMTKEQRELADYIKSHYTKSEVMIPMRDGLKLFACIYEPKDKKQKYPIMFDRTPYSVGPYGTDNYKASLGPDDLFAREGYIFVYEDVRGRYMSQGQFEDVRPYIPNKIANQIY